MRFLIPALAAFGLALPLSSQAGNGDDVVVGSVLGGGVGAVIGHQLGGRDGAIVGGVIGAAAGAAIAQDDHSDDRRYQSNRYDRGYDDGYGYRGDRYQTGYRIYEAPRYRERIVVESPRHYYRGNEFVYGYPDRDDRRGRGWNNNRWDDHGRHRGHGRERYERYDGGRVVIIEPAPRRDWRYGR